MWGKINKKEFMVKGMALLFLTTFNSNKLKTTTSSSVGEK
jgi:hypothetical protein